MQDQLLNILLASRDTVGVLHDHVRRGTHCTILQTSALLTFVTYFLALHPDVARRLRTEVLEHCGGEKAPTFEDIKNMKYSTRSLHIRYWSGALTYAHAQCAR